MQQNIKMIIEAMKSEHIDGVYQLELLAFSQPWSRESFENELKNRAAAYYVLRTEEMVVGYCGFWQILDEGHITNIAIHPEYRNKGLGLSLIKALLLAAEKREIKALTLEVRESNLAAISLYEKVGFIKYGIRPNYYDKPKENAIIMWKK